MSRVTITDVEERIHNVRYEYVDRSTIAIVRLKCGHLVIGEAHCQPSSVYSKEIGEEESLKDAQRKIFDLEVYYQRNKGREE